MHYQCPICGYPDLEAPPHSGHGSASDEICPSCGFQFGYDDDSEGITYDQWRADWIAKGMPWWSIGIPTPLGWDPVKQLQARAEHD